MADRSDRGLGGNQRLMLGGAIVAGMLFVAGIAWSLLDNPLGNAPGSVDQSQGKDLTTLPDKPVQQAGESAVGKDDPAGQPGLAGQRERAIKGSARPLSLTGEQRQKVSSVVASQPNLARTDQARFELMIGVLVPEQIQLSDIPPELTEIMNGYWGAQCLVVANQFVIVDQRTRRIVALVPLAT